MLQYIIIQYIRLIVLCWTDHVEYGLMGYLFSYLFLHWWYLFIYFIERNCTLCPYSPWKETQNAVIYIRHIFVDVSMELELIYLVFSMLWSMYTTLTKACRTVISVELVSCNIYLLCSFSVVDFNIFREEKKNTKKTVPKPPEEEHLLWLLIISTFFSTTTSFHWSWYFIINKSISDDSTICIYQIILYFLKFFPFCI